MDPFCPNLNPIHFWFWRAAKEEICPKIPQTSVDLKQKPSNYAAELTNNAWKRICQNFCVRLKACTHRKGIVLNILIAKRFFTFRYNIIYLAACILRFTGKSDTIQSIWLLVSYVLPVSQIPYNLFGCLYLTFYR